MKKNLILSILFTFVLASSLTSCKKDDDTIEDQSQVISCFEESYNGTYNGSGTIDGVHSLSIVLTLTKLSCTSCKIETSTVTDTIVSLEKSDNGEYKGKDQDGNVSSLQLTGSSLQVSTGNIDFNGTKQ